MQNFRQKINQQLYLDLTDFLQSVDLPQPLNEACLYALGLDTPNFGGKRIRPLLVASSFLSIQKQGRLNFFARRSMMAVELLHAYSLIHDDLPCMDDDDLRRGKPTCHIVFGEAIALLTGDILQALAFEALTTPNFSSESTTSTPHFDASIALQILQTFSPRARRMVAGQTRDLQGENQDLEQTQLEKIHQDKTGALIEAAVLMGAISANATPSQQQLLHTFAQKIGLAFQVQDDILDSTQDTKTLGKPAKSDEKLNKSTYIKLMGITDAQNYADQLFIEAKTLIDTEFGLQSPLGKLIDWIWQREK